MVDVLGIVQSGIQHLARLESNVEYPLYFCDLDVLKRLSSSTWSDGDKREALLLFAKYRRILIRDGFDYYAVFPKNKYNADLVNRVKTVYGHVDYLVKTHRMKPPFGLDLMPLEAVEKWAKDKVIEVKIANARRAGDSAPVK